MNSSTFSNRLREARERVGQETGHMPTQQELADAVLKHKNTVSKWEQGVSSPQRKGLYAVLARLLNVDAEWLETGKGQMGRWVPPQDGGHSDMPARLLLADLPSPHAPKRGSSQGAPADLQAWTRAGRMARLVLAESPAIDDEHLGRAIALLCELAARQGDAAIDSGLVRTILLALGR